MPSLSPKSLRQLLLRLAALGLVPMSLMAAWAIWEAVQGQQAQLERSTFELSRALASAVESEIDWTFRSLATAGRSPRLLAGDLPAFYEQMKGEVAARPEWSGVVLVDAQGRVLFKTAFPFGAADARVVDPRSLEAVLSTRRPAVGAVLPGQVEGAAFPVRWPVEVDGKLAYVLTAAVKPDRILDVVRKQQVPGSWVVSVFDGSGRRVARSKNQNSTLGGSAHPSVARLIESNGDGGTGKTSSLEGDQLLTSFTRLKPHGWTVVVGAPVEEAHRALARSLAWYLAGVLGSILICALLAYRLSAGIARAISRIRDAAVQIGDGRSTHVPRSRIVELDELSQALRAASERLSDSSASMRDALARADEAAQAKDQFLAVLGHELRNPLSPMVNVLHLLDLKADATTARERKVLRRQVDHLRRLVDDLLDISRISRGKLQMDRGPVNVFTVIERCLEALQPAFEDRNRDLRVELPPAAVWVEGDETRLVQAVSNLLTNALRFGGEAPTVLRVTPASREVQIEVRDRGIGIAADMLAHVFEPFYQSPQPLARSDGGLGLGLAIVRSVVELHGGRVTASSDGLGLGSVFNITLPTIDAPQTSPANPVPAASRKSGRILVVDDNLDALQTVGDILQIAGYDVTITADPSEALRLLETFQPEIAILDIGMPGMDGYELARAARGNGIDWSGSLVALSGYGRAVDKAKAAQAGFAAHLTKPAQPSELLLLVEQLLDRRPTAS
ncbi:MAG TPA: ATP-binding protein [Ramlibacter sp.]|jgi:signal transduction histidine kinase/CheY-like chemotaxis protein|uniref:hybrid sensor histidine kinase/response regulator n=1 Tax=Ramlibacter sp. TaxID=1917967 RepID=UPI002D6220B7|nr:ATP-binding protein [Ramlibacter sp.]HZY19055.1 ATP-binding protein [Ramlibacter sp.]